MRGEGGGIGSDVNSVQMFIKCAHSFTSRGSLKLQCTFQGEFGVTQRVLLVFSQLVACCASPHLP